MYSLFVINIVVVVRVCLFISCSKLKECVVCRKFLNLSLSLWIDVVDVLLSLQHTIWISAIVRAPSMCRLFITHINIYYFWLPRSNVHKRSTKTGDDIIIACHRMTAKAIWIRNEKNVSHNLNCAPDKRTQKWIGHLHSIFKWFMWIDAISLKTPIRMTNKMANWNSSTDRITGSVRKHTHTHTPIKSHKKFIDRKFAEID